MPVGIRRTDRLSAGEYKHSFCVQFVVNCDYKVVCAHRSFRDCVLIDARDDVKSNTAAIAGDTSLLCQLNNNDNVLIHLILIQT